MKRIVACLFLLCSLNCLFAQNAILQQVLPIAHVWSVFTVKDKAVMRFKGASDDTQLVQYSNVGYAEIRDVQTWQLIRKFDNVRFITVSPDAQTVGVLYGDNTAQIIDLQRNTIFKELHDITNLFFSPNGRYIKIGSHDMTYIIDARTWDTLHEFKTLEKSNLSFSVHDYYCGIISSEGKVQIVAVGSGEIVKEFTEKSFNNFGLSFASDGRYVAVVYDDGTSAFMEMGSWQPIKEFDQSKLLFFAGSGGGYMIHKMADNTIEIIDRRDFNVKLCVPKVVFCRVSENSKYLWVIYEDSTAHIIDILTGKIVVDNLENVEECAFTADSGKVIVALANEMQVYQLVDSLEIPL